MATYKFKSSGVNAQNGTQQNSVTKATPLPIGIRTPIQLGNQDTDGIFAMNYNLADQIADNLKNLISTNWGERIGLYDYGANLGPITTELVSSDNFDSEAMSRISTAISRWMPFVTPESFSSDIERNGNKNTGIINITLTYKVPSLGEDVRKILVTLYVI